MSDYTYCSVCLDSDDVSLEAFVRSLNMRLTSHFENVHTPSPRSSFLKTMSHALEVSVVEIQGDLRSSERDRELIFKEYNNLPAEAIISITDPSVDCSLPTLEWIGMLANRHICEFVVLCDRATFTSLHKGRQIFRVKAGADADADSVRRVYIGVTKLLYFHAVEGAGDNAGVDEADLDVAPLYRYGSSRRSYRSPSIGGDLEAAPAHEEEGEDSELVHHDEDLSTVNSSAERVSLSWLMDPENEYVIDDGSFTRAAPRAYQPGHFLDFDMTKRETLQSGAMRFDQSFDIDGIFGTCSLKELGLALKTEVEILNKAQQMQGKAKAKIAKALKSCAVTRRQQIAAFEIGKACTTLGRMASMVLVLSARRGDAEAREELEDVVNRCISYAMAFPCREEETHRPQCTTPSALISQSLTNRLAPGATSSRKKGRYSDVVARGLLRCFGEHLSFKLGELARGSEPILYYQIIDSKQHLVVSEISQAFRLIRRIDDHIDTRYMNAYVDICFSYTPQLAMERGEVWEGEASAAGGGGSSGGEKVLVSFWDAKKLSSLLFGHVVSPYRLFLTDSLGNAHFNGGIGEKIRKVNVYSTFRDNVTRPSTSSPFRFRNIGQGILDAWMGDPSRGLALERYLSQVVRELNSELNEYLDNVGNLESSSGLRYEVRISIGDMSSMMSLVASYITHQRVGEACYAVRLSLWKVFMEYQASLLLQPLLACIKDILRGFPHPLRIKEQILVASVLESLRTSTLFTGLTYSFGSELVFGRTGASLQLLRSIKRFNQPLFVIGAWRMDADVIRFEGAYGENSLDRFFKNISKNSPRIKITRLFRDMSKIWAPSVSAAEKSLLILGSYCRELKCMLLNADPRTDVEEPVKDLCEFFRFGNDSDVQVRYKGSRPLHDLVTGIFNTANLAHDTWQREFMLLFKELVVYFKDQKQAQNALEEQIRRLRLPALHYTASDKSRFFGASKCFCRVAENDTRPLFGGIATPTLARSIDNLARINPVEYTAVAVCRDRAPRRPWSAAEMERLAQGLNKHGHLKNCWKAIERDPELDFSGRRSNVDIKDKYRNLTRKHILFQRNGRYYLGSTEDDESGAQTLADNGRVGPTSSIIGTNDRRQGSLEDGLPRMRSVAPGNDEVVAVAIEGGGGNITNIQPVASDGAALGDRPLGDDRVLNDVLDELAGVQVANHLRRKLGGTAAGVRITWPMWRKNLAKSYVKPSPPTWRNIAELLCKAGILQGTSIRDEYVSTGLRSFDVMVRI